MTAAGVRDSGAGVVDVMEARQRAYDAVLPLEPEEVDLTDAIGRVLTRHLVADNDIPHYASSAMDGWAVRGEPPWVVLPPGGTIPPGHARPILTGGQVPVGAERVIRSEHAHLAADGSSLVPNEVGDPQRAGSDIRPRGEEARAGEVLVTAGSVLNPAHIAVAAACGRDLLEVSGRPRVALVMTGDEVVSSGRAAPGRVRDSFGPQLPALISMLGGTPMGRTRVPDLLQPTIDAMAAADADLIITTGGTGTSDADHVRTALEALGAEMVIPRLAARPGGPTLLARLPDGRIVVGLPGNPLAAMCGLLVLAPPLLEAWTGRELGAPISVTASRDLPGRGRSTALVPYRDVDGGAVPTAWIGSAMMRGLADATGVLMVPPSGVEAGQSLDALPLPWPVTSSAAGAPRRGAGR